MIAMGKKTVMAATITFSLLIIIVAGIQFVEVARANPVGILMQTLPTITIQRDGSVVPQTECIKQEGNVYSLTDNMTKKFVVVINCNNIVFDGQGHYINGSMDFVYVQDVKYGYYCNGIKLEEVTDVTIKDIAIFGFGKPSINISQCSRVSILASKLDSITIEQSNNATISECETDLTLKSGSSNTIFRNNLSLNVQSSNNLIFQNNIVRTQYPIIGWGYTNSWDNGALGNYWSDYSGNTPYIINANNKDNYPLIAPIDITAELPTPSPTPNPTPSSTPSPTPSPSAMPTPTPSSAPTLSPPPSSTPSSSPSQSPSSIPTQTPNPTPQPTIPEIPQTTTILIVLITAALISAAALMAIQTRKKPKHPNDPKNYKTTLITHYTHNIMWVERDHGKAY
jgi:hypothetical protein